MYCPECKDQGHLIPLETVEIVVSKATHPGETERREEVLECPDCGYQERDEDL